ncbi:hypothetical protein LQL77_31030 [Rhodococcus cerastii]|nr:hypothetical protein [Rhodococcus cerastii]
MSNYYVELTVTMQPEAGDPEAVIDPLMDAFDAVDGVRDVDLAIDLGERTLTISMYVGADAEGGAINAAIAAARTAIRAIGIPEPGSFHTFVKRADLEYR